MTRLRLVPHLAAALLGAGPVLAQTTPTQPAPAPRQPPATAPAAQKAKDQAKVELLEAGQAPQRRLRYALGTDGAEETLEMSMQMQMSVSMGGMQMPPQAVPPLITTIRATAQNRMDNGDVAYRYEIIATEVKEDATAMPMMVAMMRQAVGKLVGLSGSFTMNDRGMTVDSSVNAPPDLDPQAQQTLQSVTRSVNQGGAILPEEAVGTGGRWRVTTEVENGGVKLAQVSTYTVTQMDGNRLVLEVAVEQSAAEQLLTAPNVPAGTKLKSLKSTGKGSSDLDLRHLGPTESQVDMKTDMVMAMDQGFGDGPQDMTLAQEMKVLMKRK